MRAAAQVVTAEPPRLGIQTSGGGANARHYFTTDIPVLAFASLFLATISLS